MSDQWSARAAAERRRVAPYYAGGGLLRAKHELVRGQRAPDFVGWVLDQLSIPCEAHVLDAGAGWGRFTWPLIERFEPSRVVACDMFTDAIKEARAAGDQRGHHIPLVVADIAALPFRDAAFDWVLANHVLYHVPARRDLIRQTALHAAAATAGRRGMRSGSMTSATTPNEKGAKRDESFFWILLRVRHSLATMAGNHGRKEVVTSRTWPNLRQARMVACTASSAASRCRSIATASWYPGSISGPMSAWKAAWSPDLARSMSDWSGAGLAHGSGSMACELTIARTREAGHCGTRPRSDRRQPGPTIAVPCA
jgi:hypothetical protein